MWKMIRLYLKNFAYVYSGLGRKEVTIDLSNNDRVINLFIGKIGSGKSAILGHIQPFATYGTLDIRNQDDQILPETNGIKEIDYIHDMDLIEIRHVYTWNKHSESHNVKSYIKLNGTELNPNGNSGSFKELVRIHFGIEQNFLRVLRLGPNVANVIEMKSAERKSFIASLRSDTEIYILIHKALSEGYRSITSSLNVLSRKLVSLSSQEEDLIRDDLHSLTDEQTKVRAKHDEAQTEFFRQKGLLTNILNGRSVESLDSEWRDAACECDEKENSRDYLQDKLREIPTNQSLPEMMREIGMTEMRISQIQGQASLLEEDIQRNDLELAKFKERKALLEERDHLQVAQETLASLESRYNQNQRRLSGFQCKYSYRYLANFIDSLSIFKMQLDEIGSYSNDTLNRVYHADNSIINFSNKKVEMLTNRMVTLRRHINNLQYSAQYQAPYPLFRPPMCPTQSCPFIQTHPAIINAGHEDEAMKSALRKAAGEIQELEKTIAEYEEYPVLYQKMQGLKNTWSDVKRVLKEVGVLNHESLLNILLNPPFRSRWYDHEKLLMVLELCQIQEEQFNLEKQVQSARQELAVLESENGGNIDESIARCEETRTRLSTQLQRLTEEQTREKLSLSRLNSQYEAAEHAEENQKRVEQLNGEIDGLIQKIESLKNSVEQAQELTKSISRHEKEIFDYDSRLRSLTDKAEDLKARLRDIRFTKLEFEGAVEERNELKLIIDAASTKEGIPLVIISRFLNDCRDILNDLISDVFVDSLEVSEFDINETEFKIPYRVNGIEIGDITSASQGQQAIISIALSFALIRKSMFDYNIMLLDEVDGPLHTRDRDKFLSILFKQLQAIGANQVFLITHNNSFDNVPANIIMTTEEKIDQSASHSIIRLY